MKDITTKKQNTATTTNQQDTKNQTPKTANQDLSAKQLMEIGTQHWIKNEADEAIKYYTQAIEKDPYLVEAYIKRGCVYSLTGKEQDALADFSKAVDIAPYENSFVFRGCSLMKLNRLDEAIDDFTSALKIYPWYTDALFCRGVAYAKQNKTDEAINNLTKAITHKNHFPAAYLNRGILYIKTGKYEEALRDIQTAFNQYHPSSITYKTYIARGIAYLLTNNYKEAITDFDQALSQQPTLTYVRYWQALCYMAIRQKNNAFETLTQGLQSEPTITDLIKC